MPLTLISTPIGNIEDITLRAVKKLEGAEFIIGEEVKIIRRRLSAWGIKPQEKKIYSLNEHTDNEELLKLLELTLKEDVCLVTDCGTPSFFDPGFLLVEECIKNHVPIKSLPGVSSLTALMPYLDKKTERFDVIGFPPQKKEERLAFFQKLSSKKTPFFIMDTPYRLRKTLEDLERVLPESYFVLGINLTQDEELILRGTPKRLLLEISEGFKANFVCMGYP